jgi:hypothetical protein
MVKLQPGFRKEKGGESMLFVVQIISGQQQWYERIFREKAVRLIAAFGQGFDITVDEVEEYFGETQEVFGESLSPQEKLHDDDVIIGACRL